MLEARLGAFAVDEPESKEVIAAGDAGGFAVVFGFDGADRRRLGIRDVNDFSITGKT